MKVVTIEGLAVETVTATKRLYLKRPTKADKLTERDALIAFAHRHGWSRRRLELAFGLSRWQVNRILADIRELRAAYLACEEDAA
jgi:hypothetical protein